ncbi:hypothetical protein [Chitinophaga flava]|nr:hypothetical protein [Chitinophaga flava]
MPTITSFEELDKEIQKAGGKPLVLEALWDGDTQGWYLILSLYIETGVLFWKKQEVVQLGTVSFGGDIRLFNGAVPAWPEAELTKEWGQKAIKKYGLTFYFPSDKEPDDNCPGWTDRHLAINCADCNKLIIPTDSPYLPKEICYHCHLTRESNEKIKNAVPYDNGVTMYLFRNEEYKQIGYCSYFESFTIAPFIQHHVKHQLIEQAINVVTLDQPDIIALKEQLEHTLENKLATYQRGEIEERMKLFVSFYTCTYKGKQYELMNKYNEAHRLIIELISSWETAEEAISENYSYKIIFKKGITYRDDAILRFVNYVSKGTAAISAINKQYTGVLTEAIVMDTIKKLEQIGCLEISGDEVSITRTGKNIV